MEDFVAWRGLIESVPELPLTTSTYTRTILYAFLTMATWSITIITPQIICRMLP